jgi:hypothetical protein
MVRNSGSLSSAQISAMSAWIALLNFMEKAYLAWLCGEHERHAASGRYPLVPRRCDWRAPLVEISAHQPRTYSRDSYFHSQTLEIVLPAASTSYSKAPQPEPSAIFWELVRKNSMPR